MGDVVDDVTSGEGTSIASAVDYLTHDQIEEKKTEEEYGDDALFFDVIEDDSEFLQDMTLIGILGLEDGVRPEVGCLLG